MSQHLTPHPYCIAWRTILVQAGVRARDLAKASGVREENLSRYLKGRLWPNRTTIAKVHRGLECVLGKRQGAVDNLVEKLLITGGQYVGRMMSDPADPLYPQFVPMVIQRVKPSKPV